MIVTQVHPGFKPVAFEGVDVMKYGSLVKLTKKSVTINTDGTPSMFRYTRTHKPLFRKRKLIKPEELTPHCGVIVTFRKGDPPTVINVLRLVTKKRLNNHS